MLDKIPLEILVSIIEYLSFEDITALTCCNRFFAQFLRNDLVWWYIFRKIENEETKKSQNRKLSVLIEKKRQPEEDLTLSQLLKGNFRVESEVNWKGLLLDRKKGIDPLLRWNLFSYSWDKYEFHQIYSKKFRWNGQVVAILSDRFWKAPTDGNLKYSRPVNHIHVRMASGNVRDVRVKISKIRDISVGDYVTFVGKLDSFPKNNFFTSLNKFRYINPWKDPLAESTIPHMFQFQVLGIQVKKIHPPASNSQPNVSSSPPLIAPTLIPYVFLMVFLPLITSALYEYCIFWVKIFFEIMCFLCLINHLDPLRIFLLMVYMFWSIFGINIFPFGIMSWFWTARIASVSSPFLWENFFLIFWLPLLTSSGIWLYKYPETWIYFSELIYVVLAVPYVTDFNIRTQAFSWKQDTPVMTGLVFMGLIFIMCREYLTLILIPFYSLCFLDQTVYLIQDCYDISYNFQSSWLVTTIISGVKKLTQFVKSIFNYFVPKILLALDYVMEMISYLFSNSRRREENYSNSSKMKTKKKATTYDESHKVPENLYYPKLSKHQLNKKKSFTHNE